MTVMNCCQVMILEGGWIENRLLQETHSWFARCTYGDWYCAWSGRGFRGRPPPIWRLLLSFPPILWTSLSHFRTFCAWGPRNPPCICRPSVAPSAWLSRLCRCPPFCAGCGPSYLSGYLQVDQRACCLFWVQFQVAEGDVGGQHMESIVEDSTHFFELLRRVELDVELSQQHHELVEGNFGLWMSGDHLLHGRIELLLLLVGYLAQGGTQLACVCFHIIFIISGRTKPCNFSTEGGRTR